jgi:prolyl 4-hydroxylase
VTGYINNCGESSPTFVMSITPQMRQQTQYVMKGVLEEWIGQPEKWGELVSTSTYGVRRYTNGSTLQAHVDVVATHAVSAILNIGQEIQQDWPLQIASHDGTVHEVLMEAGEMVLYESAKAIHGRVVPLKGSHFDNIFVHYRPTDGWGDFTNVPNGGVTSDHLKKAKAKTKMKKAKKSDKAKAEKAEL